MFALSEFIEFMGERWPVRRRLARKLAEIESWSEATYKLSKKGVVARLVVDGRVVWEGAPHPQGKEQLLEKLRGEAEAEFDVSARRSFVAWGATQYAELISGMHRRRRLVFRWIPPAVFAGVGKPLHQSPNRNGRKGSTYRLIIVDDQLAWARQSDHWGAFYTAGNGDLFEPQWKWYEWELAGAPDGKLKGRPCGAVMLVEAAAIDFVTATTMGRQMGKRPLDIGRDQADVLRQTNGQEAGREEKNGIADQGV